MISRSDGFQPLAESGQRLSTSTGCSR